MTVNAKPKFIKNSPLGEDLFEGKSQEKTADLVAKTLKNKDFQIIGIDGAWGTGKSNLVKIIEKKLPDFKFFIYDVWGHQEDDQRKAILVELTELLTNESEKIVSNKSKWQQKLKTLLSKEKEVTSINRPSLSIGFILSLFLIIYVPTVNTFAKDSKDFWGIPGIFWQISLVLFPLYLIFLIYIVKVTNQLIKKKGWSSFTLAFQETFQVYNNKQVDETKIETISEKEPSVKDFRNWMKEIDNDLANSKLVLVFDNFDRLPKKHIQSIWSSIHIFFAEEKYKNIKVIVPFDRLHIRNAFSELNDKDGKNNYANDYINKTFDLVYRVSPPILSSWKVFFKSKWSEAFESFDELEYLKVEQSYEVYRPTITPREIISFINEVVSIKLLENSIPDRYISLFVLNKEIILDNPLSAITEAKFLQGLSYQYKNDEDFQKYITALAYQINPVNSLEVIYRKELKDCLINNKPEQLEKISQTNVFDKIVLSVISEIENFEKPILSLDNLKPNPDISSVLIQSIWNDVYFKIKDRQEKDFDIKEYQLTLLKHIELYQAKQWISLIINDLKLHIDFNEIAFADLIDKLNKFSLTETTNKINVFDLINTLEVREIDSESFVKLAEYKKDNFLKYSLKTNDKELSKYLSGLNTLELEKVSCLKYLKSNFDLSLFIEELYKKIEDTKSDYRSLSILYSRLKEISDKPLESKLTDSEIYSLFTQTPDSDDFYYDLVAMRIVRFNKFNTSYSSYFSAILSNEDVKISRKIAERIEFYANFGDILIACTGFSSHPLYKNIAKDIILNSYGSKVNLINVLKSFDDIIEALEIESEVLFKRLNQWNSDSITQEDITGFPVSLFECCLKLDLKLASNLLEKSKEYFLSFEKEQWQLTFEDFESHDFEVLRTIGFNEWNSYSKEGLRDSLIKAIEGKSQSNLEEWEYLFESFKKAGGDLTNTFKDIRDLLYNNGSLCTSKVFQLLITSFIENSTLKDRPGEAFRTIFKTEFLDDVELVSLMIDNSTAIKELMSLTSASDVADFKLAIKDRMSDKEDVKTLANKLGIRPTKTEKVVSL